MAAVTRPRDEHERIKPVPANIASEGFRIHGRSLPVGLWQVADPPRLDDAAAVMQGQPGCRALAVHHERELGRDALDEIGMLALGKYRKLLLAGHLHEQLVVFAGDDKKRAGCPAETGI